MIVGINGKLYSGKDTLADFLIKYLKQETGFIYEKKSFAYKLKKMGAYLTNTSEEWWFTQDGKNKLLPAWGITIGQFQQKLGTEGVRKGIHEDGWVIALMSDYQFYSKWLVTDVRFPNEARAIKDRGGVVIRIDGDPTGKRKFSTRDLAHASETAMDNYEYFDYYVTNNSSLLELETQALTLAKKLATTTNI